MAPTPEGGYATIATDITELKRRERELAEKEAQLRLALDNMPGGIRLLDNDRNYVFFNQQYLDLYDFPEGLLKVGESNRVENLYQAERGDFGPGDPVALTDHWRDAGPVTTAAASWVRDTIAGKTLQVRTAPTPDGGVVSIVIDITERKRAEQQLAEAHQLITSSIEYASHIQRSALPPDALMSEALDEYFVIWEPRDVVGGDIYWARRVEGGHIIVMADCTGHGVPGAFLTMIATGALRQAIIEHPDGDPAKVIGRMNSFIKNSLRQDTAEGPSDDGLELGICRIDEGGERLTFAGARFSLWVLNGHGAEEIKGDKSGIGYRQVPLDRTFTNHEVPQTPGSAYYLFSDGLVDQVGGDKRRAFGKKRIIAVLKEYLTRPLAKQRDAIMAAFTAYQGDEIRRDDVTFLGFRIHA